MSNTLTLDAIKILDTIARRGSFAAAAEELHRAPSTITYSVQKLEESLAVSIFDRQGYRAELTPAGEELLRDGRLVLQSVAALENNVKRVATGWEAELRIAIDDIVPHEKILQLIEDFYKVSPNTRIRLYSEILSGTWDSLLSGRSDLIIGVPADPPIGVSCQIQPLDTVEFQFVVAADHELAAAREPLTTDILQKHRVVAAADTSRGLPPKTYGLIPGQNVLTVPTQSIKHQAIIMGLGVGHMPTHIIKEDLRTKRLLTKQLEHHSSLTEERHIAWRSQNKGKALNWFTSKLSTQADRIHWFNALV